MRKVWLVDKQDVEGISGSGAAPCRKLRWSRGRRLLMRHIVAAATLGLSLAAPGWSQEAARSSGNAADDYRRAFEEIARLPDADTACPGPNEPLPSNDARQQILARLGPALKCLHDGTARQRCAWEIDLRGNGAATVLLNYPTARVLAQGAMFRARCYWQENRRDQAVADVQAVVAFARRIGDEGRTGLVGLTERYKIEQSIVDVLRQWIVDAESARSLDRVLQLVVEPERNLPKVGLLVERESLLPWLRRLVTASDLTEQEQKWRDTYAGALLKQHGAPWILQKLDEAQVHYTEVGELMELPIDQFVPKFREYIHKLDGAGNPMSQVGIVECPGIPAAYLQSRNLRAQWKLVQAASFVFQRGAGAVNETADPYGSGPFAYEPSADGFTVRSALVIDGEPVSLRFTAGARRPQPSEGSGK